jgi:hypothetical protein
MARVRMAAGLGLAIAVLVGARLLSMGSSVSGVDNGPIVMLLIAVGLAAMASLAREPATERSVVRR